MGTAGEQGAIWGARARDWVDANEPAWQPLFEAVMTRLKVGSGQRLLDVGCGAGGALAVAQARGATIAGLDASADLVAMARRRLPGAPLHVGEMEALPFPDGSFDVVTGINAFQFAGDLVNALREAGRVARPGGAVAMVVWGRRDDCDLLSKVMPAVIACLPPATAPASPAPALSQPGVIEERMQLAGLSPRDGLEIAEALAFPDLATATTAVLSASARAIAHAGEGRVRGAVEDALRPLVRADGTIRLDNRFRLVVAERP
jgi:SAM-dependent methyltransferase